MGLNKRRAANNAARKVQQDLSLFEREAIMKANNPSKDNLFITKSDTLPTTGTPVNAVAATSVLTMADVGVVGDELTIGVDIYELTDGTGLSGTGTIEVDVSGGVTKQDVVTALVSAQVASGTENVAFTDNSDDTMGIACNTKGVIGNSIAFDDSSLTNGSINQNTGADFLGGTVAGVDGTIGYLGEEYVSAAKTTFYKAMAVNTISDDNWYKVTMTKV